MNLAIRAGDDPLFSATPITSQYLDYAPLVHNDAYSRCAHHLFKPPFFPTLKSSEKYRSDVRTGLHSVLLNRGQDSS